MDQEKRKGDTFPKSLPPTDPEEGAISLKRGTKAAF